MIWGSYRIFPKIGQKATIEVFALFPIRLEDGRWLWLESYFSVREYGGWLSAFDRVQYKWKETRRIPLVIREGDV